MLPCQCSPRFWERNKISSCQEYTDWVRTQSNRESLIHYHLWRGTGPWVLPEEQRTLELKQTPCLKPQSSPEWPNTADELWHRSSTRVTLTSSEQPNHKQLKIRFQNHGITAATSNTALWLFKLLEKAQLKWLYSPKYSEEKGLLRVLDA